MIRVIASFALVIIITNLTFCQDTLKPSYKNSGRFYFYWGWNKATYSKSDIAFKGENYHFTLYQVIANDRPSPFKVDTYLNPSNMTIPQYNFRIGYFINEKYSITLGTDHMKYVVRTAQDVKIDGEIKESHTIYDGQYHNNNIPLLKGFLQLEHTDGLNYVNTELRRHDKIKKLGIFDLEMISGFGAGALVPRTDATLLNFERHDKFHLAGYGFGGLLGIQIKIGNHFFIMSEFKAGYINMPDIRTTSSVVDVAKQSFYFYQHNILFGSYFGFKKQPLH